MTIRMDRIGYLYSTHILGSCFILFQHLLPHYTFPTGSFSETLLLQPHMNSTVIPPSAFFTPPLQIKMAHKTSPISDQPQCLLVPFKQKISDVAGGGAQE